MSNLTQDFAEEVVAMFCPTTKVKITDGSDGIYLTKTNEIHCGKDWSVSGLLHEIAHAKYYLEENKTGHDGRYADILTKITDEYMSSDISYLYHAGVWICLTQDLVLNPHNSATVKLIVTKDDNAGSYDITAEVPIDNKSLYVDPFTEKLRIGVIDCGRLRDLKNQ